jgi:hypothetical protein
MAWEATRKGVSAFSRAGFANMTMDKGIAVHNAMQIPNKISVNVMTACGRITGAWIRAMANILEGGGRINTGTASILTQTSQSPRIRATNSTASKLTRFMVQISLKLV